MIPPKSFMFGSHVVMDGNYSIGLLRKTARPRAVPPVLAPSALLRPAGQAVTGWLKAAALNTDTKAAAISMLAATRSFTYALHEIQSG